MNRQHAIRLLCGIILFWSSSSYASSWQSLWARPDQQATKLLQQGDAKQAAQRFMDPNWRAIANYRAGNYQQALKDLATLNNPRALYNRGNALARLGRYEDAIKAYEETLKNHPDSKDAQFNRDLLKKLLKQNKKQQNQQQSKNNKQPSDKNKKQQKQQSKQDKKSADNKKQQQQAKPKPQNKKQQAKKPQQAPIDPRQKEKQQSDKQWLSRIPDDPGGLLRRKFLRDYQRMR